MATCFVMQPFDRGKYDKRYEEVFKPAIEAAGLESYRVDQDASVVTPITSIEDGIRNSTICLAEISEDNVNVWYELGFAFALERPVVMVCSDVRAKFPFDIAHRFVITYKTDSPNDFVALREKITKTMIARLKDGELLTQVAAEAELVSEVKGISSPELVLMASIMSESPKPGASADLWSVRQAVERAGLTGVAYQLGLHRLIARKFAREAPWESQDGERDGVLLTDAGWTWIDENESMFKLQKTAKPQPRGTRQLDFVDDDIPF